MIKESYVGRIEKALISAWNPLSLNESAYEAQYRQHAEMVYSMLCRHEPFELINEYLIEEEDRHGWLVPDSMKRLKHLRKMLRRLFPDHIPRIQNKTRFWSVIILLTGGLWTLWWGAAFWNINTRYSDELSQLSFNEYGDFVAGMASAITLVWLVLGFFMQSMTLRGNTQAVKAQLKEFKEFTGQMEKQSRQ